MEKWRQSINSTNTILKLLLKFPIQCIFFGFHVTNANSEHEKKIVKSMEPKWSVTIKSFAVNRKTKTWLLFFVLLAFAFDFSESLKIENCYKIPIDSLEAEKITQYLLNYEQAFYLQIIIWSNENKSASVHTRVQHRNWF